MDFLNPEPWVQQAIAGLPKTQFWSPVQDNYRLIIREFMSSGLRALRETSAAMTASGTILGGVAPSPGTPLTGGLLTCIPGSLISGTLDLSRNWQTPNVNVVISGVTKSYRVDTPYLRALVPAVSQALAMAWSQWVALWAAPGIPVAQGGVVAWVPGTPPLPGPWTNGTIAPFTLAPGLGIGGASASPSLSLLKQSVVAKCKTTAFVDQGTRTLINSDGPDGEDFVGSIATGLQKMLQEFVTTAQLYDPLGSSASGMAAPVTGSITVGAIAGLKIKP